MRWLAFSLIFMACCPKPKVITVHDLVLREVPKPCDPGPAPNSTTTGEARPCWQGRLAQHVLDLLLGHPEDVCLSPRLTQQLANDLGSWRLYGQKVEALCTAPTPISETP